MSLLAHWCDCRTQFGRPSTRRGRPTCVTVRLSVWPRGETMYRQASVHTPFSVTPLSSLPDVRAFARVTSLTLAARAIRNAIRANRFARILRNSNPYFYGASGRFARIIRISDSCTSPDSRESCESICSDHATKSLTVSPCLFL